MVIMALVTTFLTTPLISFIYPKKHRSQSKTVKLELRDTHEMNEGLNALLCIPSVKTVGLMMNIAHMMANHNKDHAENKQSNIHAVRMIEVTDRDSSVLMATHLDQEEFWTIDTATDILKRFAELNDIEIQTHLAISSSEEFASEINDIASSNDINMVFIPWPHPHQTEFSRPYTAIENPDPMFFNIYQLSNYRVCLVIDSGVRFLDHTKKLKVLVPFFSGKDDQEALRLSLRLSHHQSTEIHILQAVLDESLLQEDDVQMLEKIKGEKLEDVFFRKTENEDSAAAVLEEISSNNYFLIILGSQGRTIIPSDEPIEAVFGPLGQKILKVDPHISMLVVKSI